MDKYFQHQIEYELDHIEANLDAFIAQMNITSLEDLLHVYDDHELCVMDQDGKYVDDIPLNEEVDRIQRIMRSIHMKSHSYDIHMRRMLAVKVPSSIKQISHRARMATIYGIKHHIDKNYNKLAPMERAAIDRIVNNRKVLVSTMTAKMIPHIQHIEGARLVHTHHYK